MSELHPLLFELTVDGDRRSLGATDVVVARILDDLSLFDVVANALTHDDALLQSRAIHVVERVTQMQPALLQPLKERLLHELPQTKLWEVRAQLCVLLPRLDLTPNERAQAVAVAQQFLGDKRSLVRTFAMQTLFDLAQQDGAIHAEVRTIIEALTVNGTAAMRARGRKLLKAMEE